MDPTLHPNDDMIDQSVPSAFEHYQAVGEDAARLVSFGLAGRIPERILDMPCGYGRVLRHLRFMYPEADIYACEIEEEKVQFCASQFGATPFLSSTDIRSLRFPCLFDLIWCGSLLTHLDEGRFRETLSLFSRSLAAEGVAVVTVHGRCAPTFQARSGIYLSNDLFSQVEAGFRDRGFGYADYPGQNYGISVSSPSFVMSCLEADPSITIAGYFERGWDDHQDVVVIRKRRIDCEWKATQTRS